MYRFTFFLFIAALTATKISFAEQIESQGFINASGWPQGLGNGFAYVGSSVLDISSGEMLFEVRDFWQPSGIFLDDGSLVVGAQSHIEGEVKSGAVFGYSNDGKEVFKLLSPNATVRGDFGSQVLSNGENGLIIAAGGEGKVYNYDIKTRSLTKTVSTPSDWETSTFPFATVNGEFVIGGSQRELELFSTAANAVLNKLDLGEIDGFVRIAGATDEMLVIQASSSSDDLFLSVSLPDLVVSNSIGPIPRGDGPTLVALSGSSLVTLSSAPAPLLQLWDLPSNSEPVSVNLEHLLREPERSSFGNRLLFDGGHILLNRDSFGTDGGAFHFAVVPEANTSIFAAIASMFVFAMRHPR